MKKRVLVASALLVGMAVSAQAATIVGSKHDLSTGNLSATSFKSTTQNQTCVFCHTPHSALVNKLLWNRINPTAGSGFKIYTSYNNSAFRTKFPQNSLDANSSSLLCLSCHGLGSLSAIMSNTANGGQNGDNTGTGAGRASTGATWTQSGGAGLTGAAANGSLTNTHPIGINYQDAVSADTAGFKASPNTAIRFFSSQNVPNSLECASCHVVHDPTVVPFLAMSNTGSALCVACHNK